MCLDQKENQKLTQECPVAFRFGAPTGFLETLKTTRFTVGFRNTSQFEMARLHENVTF